MAVAGFEIATAQTYDTVDSRCRYYYYSQWYDTCECCYNGSPDNYANLTLREADNCSWVQAAGDAGGGGDDIAVIIIHIPLLHGGHQLRT